MMLRKNTIPPHVGIKGRINDKFPPLDKLNVCIDTVGTTFKTHTKGGGKRRILLNNFNATVSIDYELKMTTARLIVFK